jgi:hypothetical protein
MKGHWKWQAWRPHGEWRSGAWECLGAWEYDNTFTAEGLNHMLDSTFHAATQITTWYFAIFESDTTPADGTTYAVPVYTESTAYDEANRPAFVESAASGKSLNNTASKAQFTISATKTIYGAALVGGGTDADTKGDAAGGGTLMCGSKFETSRSLVDDDVLIVEMTLTLADT